MKTGWGDIEQPPFEDTVDVLSDPIDWAGTREQWRTPGINPAAENVGETGPEKSALRRGAEWWWNWGPNLPGTVARGIGERAGEEAKERVAGPVGDFFMRAAFILVGTIFVVFGMILISRPARAGALEGLAEAIAE